MWKVHESVSVWVLFDTADVEALKTGSLVFLQQFQQLITAVCQLSDASKGDVLEVPRIDNYLFDCADKAVNNRNMEVCTVNMKISYTSFHLINTKLGRFQWSENWMQSLHKTQLGV